MRPVQALAQARGTDPLPNAWGLYLAPASGVGDGLLWFREREELQAFLTQSLWQAMTGVAPEASLAAELASLFDGEPPLNWTLLDQVNLLIEDAAQIHWWGNLRQLYEGEDPFAKDLREAWRQTAGRGVQDFSAVSAEELGEFTRFLRTAFDEGDR